MYLMNILQLLWLVG